MARKISHVAIGIVILAFCIGGFTLVMNFGDAGSNTDSSYITSELNGLSANLSGYKDLDYEVGQKMSNTNDLEPTASSQIENRGSSSFGITDLLTKNILVGFINSVGKALGVPYLVISFFITIISLTITILFIRAYWGSDRI